MMFHSTTWRSRATMALVLATWCHAPAGWNLRHTRVSKLWSGRSSYSWRQIHSEMGGRDWIQKNEALVRGAPIVVGAVSMAAVVLNRTLSGVPLVASASSSLSRADVLTIALAATVLLTGLMWKSVQPKPLIAVELDGVECRRTAAHLPTHVVQELIWAWESLKSTSRSRAVVLVHKDSCLLQAGVAAELDGKPVAVDAAKLMRGSLCKEVAASGKQNYLANLALYPGRVELPFLPWNTQAVVLQPLDNGVLIIASDTVRGFDTRDQGWIKVVSQKLEATLEELSTKMLTEDRSGG